MTSPAQLAVAVRRIQWFTIGWMAVEVAIAIFAAVRAHSVALAAFGGDSAIELFSAAVVLVRFRSTCGISEALASKLNGWLLISLALYISLQSAYTLMIARAKPQPSYLGIALLVAAAFIMPLLARRKRQLAALANSAALKADAAQSSLCAYLSWIALAGLLLSAVGHFSWADPLAALGLLPIVIHEAKEAFEGRTCTCD